MFKYIGFEALMLSISRKDLEVRKSNYIKDSSYSLDIKRNSLLVLRSITKKLKYS